MRFFNGRHARHDVHDMQLHDYVMGAYASKSGTGGNGGDRGSHSGNGGNGRNYAGRIKSVFKAFVCGAAAFATLFAGAIVPAHADGGSATLSFTKDVQGVAGSKTNALKPGDQFQYVLSIQCQQSACVNAKIVDNLPNELKGFDLEGFDIGLGSGSTTYTATVDWKQGGNDLHGTKPAKVDTATSVTITPTYGLGDGKVGMEAGSTGTVTFGLRVPADFNADNPFNGQKIENQATASADDVTSITKKAPITIKAPVDLKASATAEFAPGGSGYVPDQIVRLTLGAKNESALRVGKMTVQEPQASDSADGASSLADNNPFRIFDLDALPAVPAATALQGATAVQVDAYVKEGNRWVWKTGESNPNFTLPSGVSKADVGGLRFIFTGNISAGASTSLELNLEMRSADRNDSNVKFDNIAHAITVNGTEDVTVSKGDVTSAVAQAAASASTQFILSAAELQTTISQTFNPNPVPAGNNTMAILTAENTGAPVKQFAVSTAKDKDGNASQIFNENVTFGGFTDIVNYPAGADKGKIVYHKLAGGDETVEFADGTTPASPTGNAKIKSFDAVFWANDGTNSITPSATISLKYKVKSSGTAEYGFDGNNQHVFATNAVAKVICANNNTAASGSKGTLTLTKPKTYVSVEKSVEPEGAVRPGQTVIAELQDSVKGYDTYIKPYTMTVEDSWSLKRTNSSTGAVTNASQKEPKGFWDGFNLTSIRPTQIPANTSVEVSVLTSGGWKSIYTNGAQSASYFLEKNPTDFAAALSEVSSSVNDVTGIKFVFTAAPNTTLNDQNAMSQYLGFTAREKLRSAATTDTDKTDETAQKATDYPGGDNYYGTGNVAAVAEGKADDGTAVKSADMGGAPGSIIVYPHVATPPDSEHRPGDLPTNPITYENGWIKLDFTKPQIDGVGSYSDTNDPMESIAAQSGDTTIAHARWNVTEGMKQATVTVKNDKWLKDFNLLTIPGIEAESYPEFGNNWCLKYDTIAKVELYYDGGWHEVNVTEATGHSSWQGADGSFLGLNYNTSVAPANVDETVSGKENTYKSTGFRITLVPNDAARTAALAATNPQRDPLAPQPGSGVVSTDAFARDFPSVWQLRNKKRGKAASSDLNDFVTGYTKEEGEDSSSSITSVPLTDSIEAYATTPITPSTPVHYAVGENNMVIYNYDPQIHTTAPERTDIVVPPYDTGGTYPNESYTYTAQNTSMAQASYLRITQPSECKASDGNCYMDDPTPANAKADPFSRYPNLSTGKLDQGSDLPNIFNRQDLKKITISAEYAPDVNVPDGDSIDNHVSKSDSVVWLLHFDPTKSGSSRFAETSTTVTDANNLNAEDLKDVVGISVTF